MDFVNRHDYALAFRGLWRAEALPTIVFAVAEGTRREFTSIALKGVSSMVLKSVLQAVGS
jgi:hypothetical protein